MFDFKTVLPVITEFSMVIILAASVQAQTPRTEILSIHSNGATQSDAHSLRPQISGDGRFVAFDSCVLTVQDGPRDTSWVGSPYPANYGSDASTLVDVGTDTNGRCDVFVHDRNTGQTEIASVGEDGNQSNWESYIGFGQGALSEDGQLIVFHTRGVLSKSTGPVDNNNRRDVYLRDRLDNKIELISINTAGEIGDYGGQNGVISPNGRYVAFTSQSTNFSTLVSGLSITQVYVRDRQLDTTTLITIDVTGTTIGNSSNWAGRVNDNGDVLILSNSSNLTTNDTDTKQDVFMSPHNGTGIWGPMVLASVNTAGDKATIYGATLVGCSFPSMSGRVEGKVRVVFHCAGSNLNDKYGIQIPDTNDLHDIFLREIDLTNDNNSTTELVSVNSAGEPTSDYNSIAYWVLKASQSNSTPSISNDGRFVTWHSGTDNLIPRINPDDNTEDVYLRDLVNGTTEVISISTAGDRALQDSSAEYVDWKGFFLPTSSHARLSGNGNIIVFSSFAENLVPTFNGGTGDSNWARDTFVHVRGPEVIDTDGDGVFDDVDVCPAEDASGYDNDGDGCIDDTDGDGVFDNVDVCPAEDASGLDFNGDGCIDDPTENSNDLIDDIKELIEGPTIDLNNGQIKSLLNGLNDVLKMIDKGNFNAVIEKLNTFIRKINHLVDKEELTLEEGQSLISAADAIIAVLLV